MKILKHLLDHLGHDLETLEDLFKTYMPTSYMNHKDYIRKQMPKLLLTSSLKVSLFFYFIPPKVGVKSKITSDRPV